eukprot:UN04192
MIFGRVAYGRYEASLHAAAQQQNALIDQQDEVSNGLVDVPIVNNLLSQDKHDNTVITQQEQQQQKKQNDVTIDIKPEEAIQIDPNLYVNNNDNKDKKRDEL